MSEEKKEFELKEEELKQIAGGVDTRGSRVKKVDSPAVGLLYQKIRNPSEYAFITSFNGSTGSPVYYMRGVMQADGKVHQNPNYTTPANTAYGMFCAWYNLSSSLSGDYCAG